MTPENFTTVAHNTYRGVRYCRSDENLGMSLAMSRHVVGADDVSRIKHRPSSGLSVENDVQKSEFHHQDPLANHMLPKLAESPRHPRSDA